MGEAGRAVGGCVSVHVGRGSGWNWGNSRGNGQERRETQASVSHLNLAKDGWMVGSIQTDRQQRASSVGLSDHLFLTVAPRPLGESCHHSAATWEDSNQQPMWKHCS